MHKEIVQTCFFFAIYDTCGTGKIWYSHIYSHKKCVFWRTCHVRSVYPVYLPAVRPADVPPCQKLGLPAVTAYLIACLLLLVVAIDNAVGLVLFAVSFGVASALTSGTISVVSVVVEPLVEIVLSLGLGP